MKYKIGLGYDVHRLVEGRRLILGGVTIDYPKGLAGHSDADVLTHSIIDALFGAAGLGDIGSHFPDTDERFKDIDSLVLLKKAIKKVRKKSYRIENIDSVIVAQEPKLSGHIKAMRKTLADSLKIKKKNISIKATTEEGLGFTGNKEGISCYSVCLLRRDK